MECVIETKASTLLQVLRGLRGDLHVTFEEGTWAAWLYDLIKPHVTEIVVCDPLRNALLKEGSKSDGIDARKLAELLRGNQLKPVYHGEHGVRTLKELVRSYLSKDVARVRAWAESQARGKEKIQNALMIKRTSEMASTTIRGPKISKRWLRAVSRSTVARKTPIFT